MRKNDRIAPCAIVMEYALSLKPGECLEIVAYLRLFADRRLMGVTTN